ncbi:MAG: hypothetical protein AB7U29_20315 [Desulfobulbus sp.]
MLKLKICFTLFLLTVIPTSFVLQIISLGGMYGRVFKQFSPTFYISINLIINILISFAITTVFINKTDLYNRLPTSIPGQGMMFIGGFLILLPQVLRIFTSMIEGGGASYALMQYFAPVALIAKLLLYIGVIKLLMAVKPSENYVYQ